MFRRLPETAGTTVAVTIDGKPHHAREGDSVAAAILAAGLARSRTTPARGKILGDDYWTGRKLVEDFHASGAEYVPNATVFSVTRGREIGVSTGGAAQLTTARRIIIATGALERPFPVPGWTLPGVMTAGAAQILLKSCGLVPAGRTVLAGCGPLLWLLAWQYLQPRFPLHPNLRTT